VVALTFDSGANADAVPSILATLRHGGVPATFFNLGQNMAARPGEIVLMHVGSNPDDHTTYDADALPQVISGLRAEGYLFVTLDALTG
jgi:peptidoglycan/xylan/chitin deacetylase (PgdA/CDA1 family)